MSADPATPRDASGAVDYDRGWQIWTELARFYPSAVHRRRLILDWLLPLRPRSVLDVGCGPGILLDALHARMPEARYFGVDRAAVTCAHNRTRLPWATFDPLDLGRDRLAQRFDAVVCSEVLEHVQEHEAALTHLVAMTGRWLLLTVPTGRLFPLEQGFGHLRHYELPWLCAEIERRGLRIVRAEAWGFPWMTAFKRASNLRPQAVMRRFGGGRWGLPQRALGLALTGLFYFNLHRWGPQLLILAERR